MSRKLTLIWRIIVAILLIAAVPVGIYSYESHRRVDTEGMLDVSVSIRTVSHVTIDSFGDSVWQTGSGSGFLVDTERCEVWTNHHVVADAAIIEVFPRGWSSAHGIPAQRVNTTPQHDVAIIRMDHCDAVPPVMLGDSDEVRAGDDTYAVGNPLGTNPDSISRGIISHTERYPSGPNRYLQTDAAINPGNSGGALFNHRGEVIGMNAAVAASRNGLHLGVGYAIPINVVAQAVRALHRGPPSWADAGLEGLLSPLTPDEAAVFQVPTGLAAVSIAKEPENGPSAGILEARDVIYRIGETDIVDVATAHRTIASYAPGDTVEFALVRAGRRLRVPIELADGWSEGAPRPADPYRGFLGMTLAMWTDDEPRRGRYPSPVITRVHSLGPAHRSLISSSQHAGARRGPFVVTFQLDVKTVSGVVYRGSYRPVGNVEDLEGFASAAYGSGEPLLLEIGLWQRAEPSDLEAPLELQGKAFYKVEPAPGPAEPFDELLADRFD